MSDDDKEVFDEKKLDTWCMSSWQCVLHCDYLQRTRVEEFHQHYDTCGQGAGLRTFPVGCWLPSAP